MANEVVLTLKVDSTNAVTNIEEVEKAINDTSEATKSMKAQLRELQVQLATMDPDDARFQELTNRAAELKDTIDDTAQAIRDNAGNAFEGLSNNAATLGGRLLDLDFAGVGQSARGMAANIKNINVKLLTEEVGGAVKGFATLGKALLTNPIFLVGAAIAAIIVNFESLKGLVDGVSSEMTENLDIAKEALQVERAKGESLAGSENILRLQGKSERDILNMKIAQLQAEISKAEVVNAQMDGIAEAQIQAAERNKGIVVGILQFLAAPFQLIAKQIDSISEGLVKIGVLDSSFGLSNMLNSGIDSLASMVFDPEEVRKQAAATKKESDDELRNMRNALAGHQLAIKAMDKKAGDDRLAKQKERTDAELKAKEDALKKEIELERFANDEIARMEAEMEAEKRRKEQEDIEGMREVNRIAAEMDAEQAAAREKALQDEANALAQRKELTTGSLTALMQLTEAFAGQTKKSQERAFKINKGLQIAQALIQTYQSATGAYQSQMTIPTPDAPIRAAVAAGIAVASGLAQVAKIRATKFDGGGPPPSTGGGGGGGGLGGGSASVQSGSPTFNPIDTSMLGNRPPQAMQTYVIATQVSNAQDANAKIQDLRRL